MQFNEKGCILTMMTDKVTSGGWRGYIYLVLQPFPSEMYSNVNVIEFCIPLRPILSYSSEKSYQTFQTFMLVHNLQQNLFRVYCGSTKCDEILLCRPLSSWCSTCSHESTVWMPVLNCICKGTFLGCVNLHS